MSQICHIQNVLKLILKSPRFVPFVANLVEPKANSATSVSPSVRHDYTDVRPADLVLRDPD